MGTKVRLKKGAKFERIIGFSEETGKAIRETVVGPVYVELSEAQLVNFKDLIATKEIVEEKVEEPKAEEPKGEPKAEPAKATTGGNAAPPGK